MQRKHSARGLAGVLLGADPKCLSYLASDPRDKASSHSLSFILSCHILAFVLILHEAKARGIMSRALDGSSCKQPTGPNPYLRLIVNVF